MSTPEFDGLKALVTGGAGVTAAGASSSRPGLT